MEPFGNCFVCNIELEEEKSFLNLFEEVIDEKNNITVSVAPQLGKILNIKIEPNMEDLHSSILCMDCLDEWGDYEDCKKSLQILRDGMVSRYLNTLAEIAEKREFKQTEEVIPMEEEVEQDEEEVDQVEEEEVMESGDYITYLNLEEPVQIECTVFMKQKEFGDPEDLYDIIGDMYEIDSLSGDELIGTNDVDYNAMDSENLVEFIEENDAELYICQKCEPPTHHQDISAYHQHLGDNHKMPVYKCKVCSDVYTSPLGLHTHMDVAHAGIIKTKCENCKATFESFADLRKHLMEHTNDFVCQICNKGCTTTKHLEYHMLYAHKKTDQLLIVNEKSEFKCDQCDKVLNSPNGLKVHQRVHNNAASNFACSKCDKHFRKESALQQHMTVHSVQFACKHCEKVFTGKDNLKLHKPEHKDDKSFICSICGKIFVRRNDLSDHERIHSGERPFKCDMCDAAFAQRSNLSSHKRVIHLKKKCFECTICNKSFKRRRLLDFHIKATHTGERPIACKLCPATFIYPDYYKRHLLIHQGVKPFSCDICGKHFSCRENRNAHLYVHSNKKQYECADCGEGFMRKPQLMAHKKVANHLSEEIIINEPQLSNETRRRFDEQMETSSSADDDEKNSEQAINTDAVGLSSNYNLNSEGDKEKTKEQG